MRQISFCEWSYEGGKKGFWPSNVRRGLCPLSAKADLLESVEVGAFCINLGGTAGVNVALVPSVRGKGFFVFSCVPEV